jgi:hypothetical protein
VPPAKSCMRILRVWVWANHGEWMGCVESNRRKRRGLAHGAPVSAIEAVPCEISACGGGLRLMAGPRPFWGARITQESCMDGRVCDGELGRVGIRAGAGREGMGWGDGERT